MSAGFNLADIIILAIISLSALISLFRGFVREALSLVGWIVSFWIAFTFCHPVSQLLANYIKSPTLQLLCAFGGLFIITLIFCAIVNALISKLVHSTGLSGTDRLLGIIFGVARGILLVAALLLVAHFTPMTEEDWWQNSFFIPRFTPIEAWLQSYLPDEVNPHFQLSEN